MDGICCGTCCILSSRNLSAYSVGEPHDQVLWAVFTPWLKEWSTTYQVNNDSISASHMRSLLHLLLSLAVLSCSNSDFNSALDIQPIAACFFLQKLHGIGNGTLASSLCTRLMPPKKIAKCGSQMVSVEAPTWCETLWTRSVLWGGRQRQRPRQSSTAKESSTVHCLSWARRRPVSTSATQTKKKLRDSNICWNARTSLLWLVMMYCYNLNRW